MAQSQFKHVKIRGINTVVPTREVCLNDELQYYNNDAKKIERTRKMVGFFKRRITEDGITASDLCIQAAQNLFDEMSVDTNSIDALIFVVQNPDYSSPATACVIHKALGMPLSCPAFDVNQGCSGYVYGLWLASSLIENGQCKRVLLCAGDTSSINVDFRNRVTAPVFGDAGSATLLEYSEEEVPSYFELGTNGQGYDAIIVPAGCARIPFVAGENNEDLLAEIQHDQNITHLTDIYMDGAAVFNFTMTVVPSHIKSLMSYAHVESKDLDALVLHQANRQIIQMIGAAVGMPMEKVPSSTVEKYGNQTIASIPSVICDVLAEKASTSRLNVVLSGFGVGLSWGSCSVVLDHIQCSGIKDFHKNETILSRKEWIEKWINKLGVKK